MDSMYVRMEFRRILSSLDVDLVKTHHVYAVSPFDIKWVSHVRGRGIPVDRDFILSGNE